MLTLDVDLLTCMAFTFSCRSCHPQFVDSSRQILDDMCPLRSFYMVCNTHSRDCLHPNSTRHSRLRVQEVFIKMINGSYRYVGLGCRPLDRWCSGWCSPRADLWESFSRSLSLYFPQPFRRLMAQRSELRTTCRTMLNRTDHKGKEFKVPVRPVILQPPLQWLLKTQRTREGPPWSQCCFVPFGLL